MPFITRLPALTGSDPYSDALLALDFVGARRGPQYYKALGVTTADITKIPGWTYTGGTAAGVGSYAARQDGSLQFFPSYTNLLLQSQTFDNASWTKSGSTISADATTAPDGTSTADKIVESATTASHAIIQAYAKSTVSQTYTASYYVKADARTRVAVWMNGAASGDRVEVGFNLSTGAILTPASTAGGFTAASATITALSNGWYRVTLTGTTDASASVQSRAFTLDNTATANSPSYTGDGTSGIYIWGAQLELGSTASTYIPTTTAAVTVGTPRITDAGYWAEEARTNSIRNNSMVGAVAGTPGTAPTNWSVSANGNGLSVQLVGTGTDSVTNAPYADYRFFGTTTNGNGIQIKFDTATGIAATNGQAWTISAYTALIAGSLSGFTSGPLLQFDMNNSGGAYVGNSTNTAAGTTATLTRTSLAFTTNQATTAYVQPYIVTTPGTGKTVDFTLRVSLPQMELGSFATSPIPTTSVAVTRAADVGAINPFSASAYTVLASGTSGNTGTYASLFSTNSNVVLWRTNSGPVSVRQVSPLVNVTTGVSPGTSLFTAAMSVDGSNINVSANGATVVSGAASAASIDTVQIGRIDNAFWLNGPIRRIVIYPRTFANSELQAITTAGAY